MGRHKLKIKQNQRFNIRVEPGFKKEYILFCKRNKFVLSKRIKDLLVEDLEKNK